MAKSYRMKQCSLSRGALKTVRWIPEKFAVKGKTIHIKGNGQWKVDSVGDMAVSSEYILERSQDYKHQRQASDI